MEDTMDSGTTELHLLLDRANRHVEQQRVAAVPGRRCVDGRYTGEEGTIARAGADGGYVQVLLALRAQGKITLTPQECVDRVRSGVETLGGRFTFHSDHHADEDPDSPSLGCGHLAKSTDTQLSGGYEVDPEDMKQAIVYMKQLAAQGDADMTILSGDHKEMGVLVIEDTDETVRPQGEDMYFVYDKSRDEAFMRELVATMNISGFTYEEFATVAETQTMATLHNLAPGKPIFGVNLASTEAKAKLVGYVQ